MYIYSYALFIYIYIYGYDLVCVFIHDYRSNYSVGFYGELIRLHVVFKRPLSLHYNINYIFWNELIVSPEMTFTLIVSCSTLY